MDTIADTASRHGLPAHVLRHWEDVGVLEPGRTSTGHRRYGPDHHSRIELIKCAKIAGLSLEQIRLLLDGDPEQRKNLALTHADHLDRRAMEISAARQMIGHVIDCRRQGCADCSAPHDAFGFPGPEPNN